MIFHLNCLIELAFGWAQRRLMDKKKPAFHAFNLNFVESQDRMFFPLAVAPLATKVHMMRFLIYLINFIITGRGFLRWQKSMRLFGFWLKWSSLSFPQSSGFCGCHARIVICKWSSIFGTPILHNITVVQFWPHLSDLKQLFGKMWTSW